MVLSMETVAYIRVSTEEQVHGTSLAMQEKACLDFAKANGWKLRPENIFRDAGESAKFMNRPQLLKMLDYCTKNKNKIGKCIVWKLDRFARNADDHLTIRSLLYKNGVKLVSVTEPIDDGPTGRLMEIILSGFAEFDNAIRTLRTTEGMKKRLEQGGWPHDAPVGYLKSRTKSGVTSVKPDPIMAPKLIMLLESFSTGEYNIRRAGDLAFELGIRSKKGTRRTDQTVKNTLQNPIYAGYIQSKYTNGERLAGLHKPLISSETFEKNQRILNGKHRVNIRVDETDYPLRRDFLKCAYCDNYVTASAPRGNGGKYPRYSCSRCRTSVIKKPVSRSSEEVHKEFGEILSRIRYKEGRLKLFKQVVLTRWNDEYEDALQDVKQIDHEITNLKTERASTIRKFTTDQITFEDKEVAIKEIDKDIYDLQDKKEAADLFTEEKEKIIDNAMLFLKDPFEFWNRAPLPVQKRVQRTIFPEGLVYDFEKGFGTVKINESYQLIKKMTDKSVKKSIVVAPTRLELVTSSL